MRKYLFSPVIVLSVLFAACSSDKGSTASLRVPDKQELKQAFAADGKEGKVTFTADAPWRAAVAPDSKAASASWVRLDPDHGTAGTYTVRIVLAPNLTGKSRTATITITCGGTKITVTVTQGDKNGDGTLPEPVGSRLVSRIDVTKYWRPGTVEEEREKEVWQFVYDGQDRVEKLTVSDDNDDNLVHTFSYSGNTITQNSRYYNEKEENTYITSYTLDGDGNVASWVQKEPEGEGYRGYESKGEIFYENGCMTGYQGAWKNDSDSGTSYDRGTWTNGNLTMVEDLDGGASGRCYTIAEYGNIENNPAVNIDLNYLIAGTEWLECYCYDEEGLKMFGYSGKRSKNYMTRETAHDPYSSQGAYITYEYEVNGEGLVVKITAERVNSGVENRKTVYAITYLGAD